MNPKITLKRHQNGMLLVCCGKRRALISQPIINQQLGILPSFRDCVAALESVSTPKDIFIDWDSCSFESLA